MGPVPAADSLLADRYRLLELVGVGANGQVWRAVDERLRREVAVKTVDLTVHHDDPGIVARFRREVRTSAALSSPYIAAIYDGGQDHQTAFMVMELLTGPSLAALIAEGPLDWTLGLRIAADVATGLADAHAAGIVHRDLKPANVVLHGGVAKLVDFGIARATDTTDGTLTSPGTLVGTAAYLSPEQAIGRAVTPATDLYSLGCVLFEMFGGRPPFRAGTAVALAGAHVHDAAPRLRQVRPDAPAALDALVDQLLAKSPTQRPDARTTARALARLLEGHQAEDPESTAPMAAITGPQPPIVAPLAVDAPRAESLPDADHQRTAVMPAIDVPSTPVPPTRVPPTRVPRADREADRRPRRPGGVLPWLVTFVLALALAAVAWVGLGQPTPWAPSPTVTASTSPTRTRTPPPTSTLPIVVPTPTTAPSTTSPSPTPAPTSTTPEPTAPASTPTAQPSP